MDTRNDELEQFKRLNLHDYAVSRGFVVDRKKSSRHSVVVRHPRGDKLIIGKAPTGQFFYFNALGADSGTIIDLVQALDGGTLGDVRKTLRAYDGLPAVRAPSSTLPFEIQPSRHDAAAVLSAWMRAKPIKSGHPYLTDIRGISEEVQLHPAFRDRIRIDSRGNMVVPHFNRSGLCGFELENGNRERTTFTGFSPGGVKALACSRPQSDDRTMIVCETAVDMFSVATLEGVDGKRFFSTAGQTSEMQSECLRHAAAKMPNNSRILLAFDNDEGGRKLAFQVRRALQNCGLPVHDHFPPTVGAGWNDVLQQTRQHDSPEPQMRG
ncbi:DUF3991 and TOPRIM domain-containing protein [Rubripirellula lacrimiformis]|nr:DUF3991 and TOPRIM domain-containing protein [Rubripirellula lacrimiformis]